MLLSKLYRIWLAHWHIATNYWDRQQNYDTHILSLLWKVTKNRAEPESATTLLTMEETALETPSSNNQHVLTRAAIPNWTEIRPSKISRGRRPSRKRNKIHWCEKDIQIRMRSKNSGCYIGAIFMKNLISEHQNLYSQVDGLNEKVDDWIRKRGEKFEL